MRIGDILTINNIKTDKWIKSHTDKNTGITTYLSPDSEHKFRATFRGDCGTAEVESNN